MAYNIDKLMARNPTFLGRVMGVRFFEHPTCGGDTGMIAIWRDKAVQTDWYDLPRREDIECPRDFMNIYGAGFDPSKEA